MIISKFRIFNSSGYGIIYFLIYMSKIRVYCIFFILMLCACGQDRQDDSFKQSIDLTEFLETNTEEVRMISYKMSLPVEMAGLFDHVGANFYPELLNPADQFGKYTEPVKLALNLGVYGVDLSYSKMFNQHSRSVAYMTAINRIAGEMGIPREIYGDVLDNMEFLISNRDSLSVIAENIYRATDDFLKKDDQEGAASLVAMGGWIESMYIASRILEMDPENIALQEKIAEQKYSLNSLIALMNNYHSDLDLAEYLLMLKNLRRTYDGFEIYYKKGNVAVDTSSKSISTTGYYINVSPGQMGEITTKIGHLRTLIVH